MRDVFAANGIDFVEIPRLEQDGQVISASYVRALLKEKGVCREVLALVPPCTQNYLMNEWKDLSW